MPRTSASDFRRGGSYDLSGQSPAVLNGILKNLCFTYGYHAVETSLRGLASEFGLTTHAPDPREPTTPGRGRRKNRRSTGALQAWDTRRAVERYMAEHPKVTKEDALAHVREEMAKSRTTGDESQETRGTKAWETKAQAVIEEFKAEGKEPPTMADARKIVSRRMRNGESNKERKSTRSKPAESTEAGAPAAA